LALEELRGDQGLQKRGQDASGYIAVLLVASTEGVLYGQYFMGTYHHLVEADRIKGWERSWSEHEQDAAQEQELKAL
jgi:hypothetical protein